MADLKTKVNRKSVGRFLQSIADPGMRADAREISRMMREATGARPKMWGSSIVGFGSYRYRYASGREGEWPLTGFAPRTRNLTLYIMSGFDGYESLLKKLGKFTTGKSCLYIKSLEDIHRPTLRQLIRRSVRHVARGGR